MIERLILALQALAAPANVQLARFPEFVVKELVLDFDDALRLMLDCPQLELTPEQIDGLERVDAYFEGRSGGDRGDFWLEAAVRSSPEWQTARELAARALAELDAPRELPPESAHDRLMGGA